MEKTKSSRASSSKKRSTSRKNRINSTTRGDPETNGASRSARITSSTRGSRSDDVQRPGSFQSRAPNAQSRSPRDDVRSPGRYGSAGRSHDDKRVENAQDRRAKTNRGDRDSVRGSRFDDRDDQSNRFAGKRRVREDYDRLGSDQRYASERREQIEEPTWDVADDDRRPQRASYREPDELPVGDREYRQEPWLARDSSSGFDRDDEESDENEEWRAAERSRAYELYGDARDHGRHTPSEDRHGRMRLHAEVDSRRSRNPRGGHGQR